MKVKNSNISPYIYLVLGCVGVIGMLTIIVPLIYDHYRDTGILSNAINHNVINNNEKLATINRRMLESENRNFHSTIVSMVFPATIPLGFIIGGIIMIHFQKRNQKQDITKDVIEIE